MPSTTAQADEAGSFALAFDRQAKVLLVTLGKDSTESTLTAAYRAVEHFVTAEGPCSGITDFTECADFAPGPELVRRLAASPPAIPMGWLRILVTPQPAQFGMARMFELLRGGMEGQLRVVHTLEEAYAILGLSQPAFTPIEPSSPDDADAQTATKS